MLANRTSRWSIAAAVLCIALLAASWFLLVSPRRADAADTRSQSVAAQSQADLLQQKIDQLKVQYADLPKRRAELDAIRKELPISAAIPKFVRDLQAYAAQSGVALSTVVPGSPTVVTAAGNPAAAPASGGPAATSSSPQLVGVPMTITINGEYFEAALFIKYLQTKLDRALLISSVAVAPGTETTAATSTATSTSTAAPTATAAPTVTSTPDSDVVGVTITGSIFVLLDGSSTLADVTKEAKEAALGTAATPTPAATATPTTTATAN